MKKRLGRPRLKAEERKQIFPLRLSALELKAIKRAAGKEPLSKWMRRTLLNAISTEEDRIKRDILLNAISTKEDRIKTGMRALKDGDFVVSKLTKAGLSSLIPPSSTRVRMPVVHRLERRESPPRATSPT